MKICTKCKIERNDDEYYSYWHSTQQKYRTRLICSTCTRKQSKEYKLKRKLKNIIPEVVETKYCPRCKQDLAITNFYESNLSNGRPCISCTRKEYQASKYKKAMSQEGSGLVSKEPGTWMDDIQKEQVHMVLGILGWTYNEDTNIFSKEGVKDKFGTWLNFIPTGYKKRRPNGVIVRKKHGVHKYIDEIIQRKEEGMTYEELAYIYCCSHTTLRTIVNTYYREKKA